MTDDRDDDAPDDTDPTDLADPDAGDAEVFAADLEWLAAQPPGSAGGAAGDDIHL